jgi:acetyltransferase-like isoleucine patch superfamily enzyme
MIKTHIIYDNVKIGPHSTVEDYCIIGVPPKDQTEGDRETVIGKNALIRSHTVIYSGNRIGNNFQTGNKANIRELNKIGNDVSIGTLTAIEHHVSIGDHVRIHGQAFISEYSVIEEYAWIGPNVVLTNARYPLAPDAKETLIGPTIKKGAKIGANSTILPGVVIGENAFVGAGSLVTKNVAEGAVVVGNPARIIKSISELPY